MSVRFDPIAAPLDGVDLVEANAGTGKTWAITALYVRLLLEAKLDVEAILVVTFTEAATGELRDRIRNRLAETRAAFARGMAPKDDVLAQALLARVSDREDARLRLAIALRDFDRAPIYTIHGFCQRVLGDSAFDAGMPFRTEIVPDQSALLREIVEDFWRNEVHGASALFTRYLAKLRLKPETLLTDDVERCIGKPYLDVRSPAAPGRLADLERAYEAASADARRLWLAGREAIGGMLVGSPHLNLNTYRRKSVAGWLEDMHACLSPEAAGLDLCRQFDKFTPESLSKATKGGGTTPKHAFFDACSALRAAHTALMDAYQRSVILMKVRLLEYCNAELEKRKERRQLQSFDDLLLNLQKALNDKGGAALAATLRDRYKAALIDEFQDTDPVQYDIFRSIYGGQQQPLFLVGDPKQSIYSFRGADVYAYIDARADSRHAQTLDVNWRSTPGLLTAINCIFENAPQPFVIDEIGFTASRAAPRDPGAFTIEGEKGAPFEIWLLESEDGKPLTRTDAGNAACNATASEIARLLGLGDVAQVDDGTGARPLRGGDIAVLVRSHRHAQAIRDALAARGVASVQRGAESVFDSREAEELERVLAAIAEPGRESLIAAALSTEMMGVSGAGLHALRADEKRWEEMTDTFREAHRAWHEAGFVRMLRAFLKRHDVLPRLLEYSDGERRATNLLHLSELLHTDAERQGIGGLLAWLAAKRMSPAEGNETELLRLESDENLVKILTVHAAKGLEFPLVFCPYAYDFTPREAKPGAAVRFHDPRQGHRPAVDFGSDGLSAAHDQALLEDRAETLRLLYVALTRAKYRCWMVWGHVKDAEMSAPAWLLHRQATEVTAAFGDAGVHLSAKGIRADLERIAKRAEGAIRVSPLPASEAEYQPQVTAVAALAARAFAGSLRDTRRVTSFTALAHGRSIEAPDYDASDQEPRVESVSGRDIFAFPRGAQAGKCLHAVFEQVDFARLARPELERVVRRELGLHGFEDAWLAAVSDMVEAVVETPLDETGMRLAAVARDRRLDEVEFYYPIAALSDAGLRGVLREGGFPDEIRSRIGELAFAPASGYMRGFIDLVFEHGGRYYLADYKSNWLGPAASDYAQADLARAMGREAYYLQYLVYCVALHRYLAARVRGYRYETHFGGVRYLFLRGMQPAAGHTLGVYADRPAWKLIEALDLSLRGTT